MYCVVRPMMGRLTQTFFFLSYSLNNTVNYLHGTYIVLGIVSNLERFKVYSRMSVVTCKYYAILYKGLEHPWTLVSLGS